MTSIPVLAVKTESVISCIMRFFSTERDDQTTTGAAKIITDVISTTRTHNNPFFIFHPSNEFVQNKSNLQLITTFCYSPKSP